MHRKSAELNVPRSVVDETQIPKGPTRVLSTCSVGACSFTHAERSIPVVSYYSTVSHERGGEW